MTLEKVIKLLESKYEQAQNTEYVRKPHSIDDTKPPIWTDEHIYELVNDFLIIPNDTPTADVVEVVRCSKCKQWIKNSNFPTDTSGFCFYHYIDTNENDFCSYRERRDE